MNPEQQAVQLINEFTDYFEHSSESQGDYYAIQNSLKCVDQIRKFMTEKLKWTYKHNSNLIYWEEVEDELIKRAHELKNS